MLKKLHEAFLCALFVLIVAGTAAQGTLEYRAVKLISNSQTVPVSKVWKVESILSTMSDPATAGSNTPRILVNGSSIYLADRNRAATSNNAFFPAMLPMWLPAGTTLAPSTNISLISVIEFEIVP